MSLNEWVALIGGLALLCGLVLFFWKAVYYN